MHADFFEITFSNQIETLFDHLKEHLFYRKKNPFERILVIVPSPALKSWLMRRAISDPELQVAFGFEVLYLNEAIRKFFGESGNNHLRCIPDRYELALSIENIEKHQENSLQKTLNHKEKVQRAERGTISALEIADLFLQYGEYAPEEMDVWLKTEAKEVMQELWQRLFRPPSAWMTFHQAVQNISHIRKDLYQSAHLFAFSHLSPIKHTLFQRISEFIPVKGWILSPTRMFWSDLYSEKEIHRLDKKGISKLQREALEEAFQESNSLLCNLGKLGRVWLKNLEETPSLVHESYKISSKVAVKEPYQEILLDGVEEEHTPFTLLHAMQADLVLLRPQEKVIPLNKEDLSVEILSSPSIRREVEVLYQTLLHTLQTTSLNPSEIVVMVPRLEKYTPYIKSIFNSKDSPVNAEISDISSVIEEPFLQTFIQIFELPKQRWELNNLFDLISKPQFKSTLSFKREEMGELKKAFHKAGVRWGLSKEHREEIVQRSLADQKAIGTFEAGFEALLLSLGERNSAEDFLRDESLEHIQRQNTPFSLAEAIGDFMQIVESLKKYLKPLSFEPSWTLAEWGNFLSQLLELFLEGKTGEDEEAKQEIERLLNKLRAFHNKQPNGLISYSSLIIYLKEMLSESKYAFREKNLNAVRFCAMLPMRAYPAKVIALLGLNAEDFPRRTKKSGFDILKDSASKIPSLADHDRYLFLESLLSAREKWILSYVSGPKEEPSSAIQEVISYIDARFNMEGERPSKFIHKKHPANSYDIRYPNYSERSYRNAKATLNPTLKQKAPFFQEPLCLEKEELPLEISLMQLKSAFSHPLKTYLNKRLKIYLNNPNLPHSAFEEIEQEDIYYSEWLKWALKYPMERVVALADEMGKFPIEPFKEVAVNHFKTTLQEHLDVLHKHAIHPHEVFEIEFTYDVLEPKQVSQNKWHIPALKIPYRNKHIYITGVLPYISSQGMLSTRDLKLEAMISLLPEMMLHHHVPEQISAKNIHSLKKEKSKKTVSANWEAVLDHYLRTQVQPCPSLPTWVDPILQKDATELKKKIQLLNSVFSKASNDPYFQWVHASLLETDPEEIIEKWHAPVSELFKDFSEEKVP